MKNLIKMTILTMTLITGCGSASAPPTAPPTASVGSGTPYQVLERILLDHQTPGHIDTSQGFAEYVFADSTWVGAYQATVNQDPKPTNGYLIQIADDKTDGNNGVWPITALTWDGAGDVTIDARLTTQTDECWGCAAP